MQVNLEEQIAGARAYEQLHVPALFEQWCPRLLDAAETDSGDRLLDVACGTGVLARHAAERVGPDGFVSGLDAGPGMLAVAAELAPHIEWKEGLAEVLPYPDDSFDAVCCQFGLMFFGDRIKAIQEMVRVLRPGKKLAVSVWDSLERSEAYPEELDLLQRLAGDEAANALRAPFVLGDKEALAGLFEESGVEAVSVTTHNGTARFPSIRSLVEVDLRGWLPIMGVQLAEPLIQAILDEAEHALARYRSPEGQAVFNAPAHIVTGIAA